MTRATLLGLTSLTLALWIAAVDRLKGQSVMAGTHTQISGAARQGGRLAFTTNGTYLIRDSGASLEYWGPVFKLTPPPAAATFTWRNQGTATATDSDGSIVIADPNHGAGFNNRGICWAVPAAPYTYTAAFQTQNASGSGAGMGLGFSETTNFDSKTHGIGYNGAGSISVDKWTNNTTLFANVMSLPAVAQSGGPGLFFLRVTNDGVNKSFKYGYDGSHWFTASTTTSADFFTPGYACIGTDAVSQDMKLILKSWVQE